MVGKEPVYFDPETISALRDILDEAWNRLPPERQVTTLKSTLADYNAQEHAGRPPP